MMLTSKKLDHIQILRGASVLMVVLYHYFAEIFAGGFVGVDIFFVISGYVITKSLVSEKKLSLDSLVNFYRHRLFRIVPGYLVVGLAVFLTAFFMYLPEDMKNVSKHLAASTLFANNLLLYLEVGYFDIGGELKPLLHYWSLSVEEQFYLVYPILLLLTFRIFREKKHRITFLGYICAFSAASFFAISREYPSFAFYMMPTRFWELACGAILYVGGLNSRTGENPSSKVIALTCLVVSLSAIRIEQKAILIIIAVAFAIIYLAFASCTLKKDGMYSWFLHPLKNLGTISYSLYLTHWPVYSIAFTLNQGQLSASFKTSLIALSLIFAVFLYKFVELPMIRLGHQTARINKYLTKESFSLLVVMLIIFGSGFYGFISNGFETYSTGEKHKLSIAGHWDHQFAHCDRPAGKKYDFDLSCTSNWNLYRKKFVVIGDSHADHYFIGLSRVGAQYGYSGMHVGTNGCPPLIGVNRTERPLCSKYLSDMLDAVISDANIDTIFIAARWAYYMQGITSPGEPVGLVHFQDASWSKSIDNVSAVRSGLKDMIALLRANNKRVIVIDQVPEFSIDPRKFQFYRNTVLTVSEQAFRIRRTNIVRDVVHSFPEYGKDIHIQYFDPANLFCNNGHCKATHNDEFYFRDDDHLNLNGSMLVASEILEFIENRQFILQ